MWGYTRERQAPIWLSVVKHDLIIGHTWINPLQIYASDPL